MKELTLQQAYDFAVMKWEYIVKHDGYPIGLLTNHPELGAFRYNCSYCAIFHDFENCSNECPLKNKKYKGIGCMKPGHPYKKWTKNPTKKTAQAVLDLIIKTKP